MSRNVIAFDNLVWFARADHFVYDLACALLSVVTVPLPYPRVRVLRKKCIVQMCVPHFLRTHALPFFSDNTDSNVKCAHTSYPTTMVVDPIRVSAGRVAATRVDVVDLLSPNRIRHGASTNIHRKIAMRMDVDMHIMLQTAIT